MRQQPKPINRPSLVIRYLPIYPHNVIGTLWGRRIVAYATVSGAAIAQLTYCAGDVSKMFLHAGQQK